MTKFSGTVISKISKSGKTTTYKMAVNNFTSKDSTDKPEATWITLDFINPGLEKYLGEHQFAQVNGKNPHVCISNGQLITKSYIDSQSGKKVSYLTLKVFKEEDVKVTVFEKGVNSSFNSVENVYCRATEDFVAFGESGMKGGIAINYKTYSDRHGNEVRPTAFLRATMFNVVPNIAEMLKKGQTIKIIKANFKTTTYEKDGSTRSSTELILREYEIIVDQAQAEQTSVEVNGNSVPVIIEDNQTPVNVSADTEITEDEIPF